MSDEDSPLEEDESEFLVYVEFEGTARSDIFAKGNVQLDMIGLDMEHPIMRVNDRYYEGTYEDAVGTYMFFEKDKNPIVDDPVFDIPPKLKYSTKTRKVLKMKRVFVKPRLDVMGDSNYSECIPTVETLKEAGVPPAYQGEALNLWNDMRKDRLEALNEYLEKQKIREEKRSKGIEPDSESDEDSPFAMYKTKPNDSEESPLTNINKSTVIDPAPSTSKDHLFSSNYGSTENAKSTALSTSIKNQGYIGVYPRQRRKVKKQTIETSDSSSRDNCTADNDNKSQINSAEDQSEVSEEHVQKEPEELSEKCEEKSEELSEKCDSDAISQTSDVDSQDDGVEYISDKKLEKQQKRRAKIKEISERLKRAADEIKSKTTP